MFAPTWPHEPRDRWKAHDGGRPPHTTWPSTHEIRSVLAPATEATLRRSRSRRRAIDRGLIGLAAQGAHDRARRDLLDPREQAAVDRQDDRGDDDQARQR